MNDVLSILDNILAEIEGRYARGEALSPELKAELSLLMEETAAFITQQGVAPQSVVSGPKEPELAIQEAQKDQAVNLLWIMSNANPEVFKDFIQTYPDPAVKGLANNPAELIATIKRLETQQPPTEGPTVDGVPAAPISSSNIFGFDYDPRKKQLVVKFQGNGNYGDGPVYVYGGVPPVIADLFMRGAHPAKTSGKNKWSRWWRHKTPSLGSSMHHFIKLGGYPYRKIS